MGRPRQDLTGMIFDRWVVLERARKRWGHSYWTCRCDCGTVRDVYQCNLTGGKTRSCGCLIGETAAIVQYSHGHNTRNHTSPTYTAWASMKQRCFDPGQKSFPRYGGRGITVCDRWQKSFEAFLADMGVRPTVFHSLERIDNDGPYSPDNCRWASKSDQARNRRSSRLLTFRGETRTVAEWAEVTGIAAATIQVRVDGLGWSVEKALTETTKLNGGRMLEFKGETHTLVGWSRILGCSIRVLTERIDKKGWTVERALSTQIRSRDPNGGGLITFKGKTKTLSEWAQVTGIPLSVIRKRLKYHGWTVERSLTTKHRVYI